MIVDDINRISRSLEVHLMFRERLKAIGARFESPTQKFGEGADDRMVEMMLVNVAEYQRLKNAEQTKKPHVGADEERILGLSGSARLQIRKGRRARQIAGA